MTAAEARQNMLDWAEGHRSHNNIMLQTEGSSESRPQTLAAIEQADSAEVVKWAAVYQALLAAEATIGLDAEERRRLFDLVSQPCPPGPTKDLDIRLMEKLR